MARTKEERIQEVVNNFKQMAADLKAHGKLDLKAIEYITLSQTNAILKIHEEYEEGVSNE